MDPESGASMIDVRVISAEREDASLIARMMQLYLHDLSEFDHEQISSEGTFVYRYLDLYWIKENRYPFLIRDGEELVGFALVRTLPSGVHTMAEFFILRSQRGKRRGSIAAGSLFSLFKGRWRVAQEQENVAAQVFWRNVIGDITFGKFQEARSSVSPNGPVQIFDLG